MNKKQQLAKKIGSYDFAIYEMVLYLDTHPTNKKALELIRNYRKMREAAIEQYERQFGKYVTTAATAPAENRWEWVDGPWPWELCEEE